MTQLAEKQKPSLDTLPNDQIDLAKFKSLERHASEPVFTYEQDTNAEDGNAVTGIARVKSREDDTVFEAAFFCVTKDGQMFWNVNQSETNGGEVHPNAVSIVLARHDGTVEQLGAGATEGEINDIAAKDVIYIIPNQDLLVASDSRMLTKESLDDFARANVESDIVRVSLDESTELAPAAQPVVIPPAATPKTANDNAQKVAQRKQNEKRQANERQKAAQKASAPQAAAATTTPAPASAAPVSTPSAARPAAGTSHETGSTYSLSQEKLDILDRMKQRRQAANGNTATRPLAVTPEAQNTSNASASQEAEPVDPAIERAREKLSTLRGEMAAVAAKRQGRLFNFNNKAHAKLQEEYKQQLETLGKLECGDLLNDDTKTDSEKNVGVIGFIFDEQQKLREETAEGLKNSKVSKMIEWLHEGTKTQRFLKAAAIGAGGVLIGAGIGAVFGAAAGVGLAAAAAKTTTSVLRFGRYYAREDNKAGRGITKLDGAQASEAKLHAMQAIEQSRDGNRFDVATDHFKNMFDADTRREQEKRRMSSRRAIGGVAVGMLVGGAAAYAIGELAESGKLSDWMGGQQVEAKAGIEHNDVDPAGGNHPPEVVKGPEVAPPVEHDFSPTAETIDMGEGWLQTFNEAGITDVSQQYALLNNQALMQELANKGLAYPDANIGGWGINMTADGKMPADALKLIETYANRNGYNLAS